MAVFRSIRSHLNPTTVYSPRSFAAETEIGLDTVYDAIRRSLLKAAQINNRGDYKILGSWGLEYFERLVSDRVFTQPTHPRGRPRSAPSKAPTALADHDEPSTDATQTVGGSLTAD
jgi:hypothetical protein